MASYFISNAPDMGGINSFWSSVSNYGGIMRPNRFAVMFPTPPGLGGGAQATEELAYMCDTAELPARGFAVQPYKYYGPPRVIPTGVDLQQISFQFILRNSMLEKEFFDNWFELIVPSDYFDIAYKKDYTTQIKIFTLSKSAEDEFYGTYSMSLRNAWPSNMSAIPLSAGETGFGKLEVTFIYDKMFREGIDPQPQQFEIVKDVTSDNQTREGGTTFPPVVLPELRKS